MYSICAASTVFLKTELCPLVHAAALSRQIAPRSCYRRALHLAFYCVPLIVNKSLGHTLPDRPIAGVMSDSFCCRSPTPSATYFASTEHRSSALKSPALESPMDEDPFEIQPIFFPGRLAGWSQGMEVRVVCTGYGKVILHFCSVKCLVHNQTVSLPHSLQHVYCVKTDKSYSKE